LSFFVGFFVLFYSINGLGVSIDMKNMGLKNWGQRRFHECTRTYPCFYPDLESCLCRTHDCDLDWCSFYTAGIGVILIPLGLRKLKNFPGNLSDELKKLIEAIKAEYHGAVNK